MDTDKETIETKECLKARQKRETEEELSHEESFEPTMQIKRAEQEWRVAT